jgi:DNA-dependent RNA polymerase auxiliary subunit epsilon
MFKKWKNLYFQSSSSSSSNFWSSELLTDPSHPVLVVVGGIIGINSYNWASASSITEIILLIRDERVDGLLNEKLNERNTLSQNKYVISFIDLFSASVLNYSAIFVTTEFV